MNSLRTNYITGYDTILVMNGHHHRIASSRPDFQLIWYTTTYNLVYPRDSSIPTGRSYADYHTIWLPKGHNEGNLLALIAIKNRLALYKARISGSFNAN